MGAFAASTTSHQKRRVVNRSKDRRALVIEADYFSLTSKNDPNVVFWNAAHVHQEIPIPRGVKYVWMAPTVVQQHRTRITAEAESRGIEVWNFGMYTMRAMLLPIWKHDHNRTDPDPVVVSDRGTYGGRTVEPIAAKLEARFRAYQAAGKITAKDGVDAKPEPAKVLQMPVAITVAKVAPTKVPDPVRAKIALRKPSKRQVELNMLLKQLDEIEDFVQNVRNDVAGAREGRRRLTKGQLYVLSEWINGLHLVSVS
jgi:hypothetical protein